MKRRLFIALLVAFTIWPLVHRRIVVAFDSDPWKLFGWAMYCVPKQRTFVQVGEVKFDEVRSIHDFTRTSRRAILRYQSMRGLIGELASQEHLAWMLLREHPDFDGVAIAVTRIRVDPETARVVSVEETTRYMR